MANMHSNFDEYALDCLKRKVSEKIGYQISNRPDCLKLSEIISKKGTFTDIGITCVLHGSDAVLTAKEICG